jgi:hypothetical protein|eukprot:COSAG01_NODE_8477_length_2771_cov_42.866018_2_plen_81_part_00
MWNAVQVSHSLCIMRGVPRGDERGGVLHVALLLPANLPITPLHLVGCPPVRMCLPVHDELIPMYLPCHHVTGTCHLPTWG